MNTPTTEAGLEVLKRLREAVEACEQTQGADKPYEVYAGFRGDLANAAHPDTVRILIDAFDSVIAREAATRAEVEALRADVKRYCWLADRFLGADFRWNEDEESGHPGCQALVFAWPGGPVWGDLTLTLDAALSGLAATSVATKKD